MKMQMLDKKIEYFLIAAEEGSFSAAARRLYLSQANLSKQITQLETELGVTLFDRNGYRPVLTTAGKYFYKKAAQLKKMTEEILESLEKDWSRTINVGFTGAFENREILDAVKSFQKKHPDITVSRRKPMTVREMFEDMENHLVGTRTSTEK